MKNFSWLGINAPHWNGRTGPLATVVGSVAAVAAVVVSLLISVHPSETSSTPPQQAAPAGAASSKPPDTDSLCGASSDDQVADGWGPARSIFYDDTFPTALTFNSTGENEGIGDERNFVAGKAATDKRGGSWSDTIEVTDGGEYLVRAYARLDGPDTHEATDARLMFNLPACIAHRIGVIGFVTASNVFPDEVWDGMSFWSRHDFTLALVPDSAYLYNNSHPEGQALSTQDLERVPVGSDRRFWDDRDRGCVVTAAGAGWAVGTG